MWSSCDKLWLGSVHPFAEIVALESKNLLFTVKDLSRILDGHAPLVSGLRTRQHAGWLSESYRLARSLRHQFERAWRKHKSQYNRSRLWRRIAWCNHLANRDKTVYYRKLISDNSHDSKNYGGSYIKSYIDPTALLCPLVNPQSHWLIVLLHFSQIKS